MGKLNEHMGENKIKSFAQLWSLIRQKYTIIKYQEQGGIDDETRENLRGFLRWVLRFLTRISLPSQKDRKAVIN